MWVIELIINASALIADVLFALVSFYSLTSWEPRCFCCFSFSLLTARVWYYRFIVLEFKKNLLTTWPFTVSMWCRGTKSEVLIFHSDEQILNELLHRVLG